MSSINVHLRKIQDEINELLNKHVTQPDEMANVKRLEFYASEVRESFIYTKDINAEAE